MYQTRVFAPASKSLELSDMQSIPRRYDTLIVLAFAATLHLFMFAFDVAMQFPAFLRGDRSPVRWFGVEALRAADASHLVSTLTSAPTAPGEYLFGYVFGLFGGIAAIVAFQTVLFLLSLLCLCKIAERLPWRHSVLVFGTIYTLLPHNLVFTHQFVTEAIATPFIVFFIYFYCRAARSGRTSDALLCGLMLGVAIFVRPPLMPIVPLLVLVRVLYRRYFSAVNWRSVAMICGVAILPMVAWSAVYTAETGRVGYTSGVANLGWNLRSKVFLVYSRNGLEQPAPLRGYADYPSLYNDSKGISVADFAGYVARHPLLFAQSATSDALIFLGRADISKVFVDYLGDPNTARYKDWRSWVSKAGIAEVLELLAHKSDALLLIVAELLLSVVTLAFSGAALFFACYAFLRPSRISALLGESHAALVLVLSSVLIAVFMSAQLVDQAQGRLRHPAEACIMLLLGYAIWYSSTRKGQAKSQEEAAPPA